MDPMGGAARAEKSRKLLILGAVLIVLVGIIWYFGSKSLKVSIPGSPVGGMGGGAAAQTADLGSTIYNQANNPVSGNIPQSAATVPNPIEGMYKNPF